MGWGEESFLGVVGGRGVLGGGLVSLRGVGSVLGLSFVPHISNVAGVGISNRVGDNLGPAVGEVDAVLSVGGVTVTGLVLGKVGLGIVISDGVGVLVLGRLIVLGLGSVGSRVDRGSDSGGHDGGEGNDELE